MRITAAVPRLCLRLSLCFAGLQIASSGCVANSTKGLSKNEAGTVDTNGAIHRILSSGASQAIGYSSGQGDVQAVGQEAIVNTDHGQPGVQVDTAMQNGAMKVGDNAPQVQTLQCIRDTSAAVVGATPPNNAVMPVLGPPDNAVVSVAGPANNAVVDVAQPSAAVMPATSSGPIGGSTSLNINGEGLPVATAGGAGSPGASPSGSSASLSSAPSCNNCRCNCPASFGAIVNQAVMMAASATPAQSDITTSISVVQNNMQGAAPSQNSAPDTSLSSAATSVTTIPIDTSLLPSSTASTSNALSPTISSVAITTMSTLASSTPSATVASPEVTPAQNSIAPDVATPPASTAEAVTAGAAPVPVVSGLSTFKFESAVTVPLKIRRARSTAAVG